MNLFPFNLRRQYQVLNTIEVSKDNLLYNYKYLSKLSGMKIAPVLKSNAYGHGLVQVAKALDHVGAPFFCVDSLHEAYILHKAHIKTPILIMGYIEPQNLRVKKLPFSYAVYEEKLLDAIKKYQSHAKIHIFVDTGMHREGILLNQLDQFVQKAKRYGLHIEGLMSHFAQSDKPSNTHTQKQVKTFQEAKQKLAKLGIIPHYIHIANSSGVLHAKEYPQDLGNMGRVGIALFGIDPEGKNKNLKPVLTLKTKIIQMKEIKKGEKVGYDFTFTNQEDMKLGILPIGYNDGVNRKLSNKGYVKVGNTFCPIVGRVSMNITIIDVSKVKNLQIGDEVVVYSDNPKDKNSIQGDAKLCDVIPYEILVQLHASTKRRVLLVTWAKT